MKRMPSCKTPLPSAVELSEPSRAMPVAAAVSLSLTLLVAGSWSLGSFDPAPTGSENRMGALLNSSALSEALGLSEPEAQASDVRRIDLALLGTDTARKVENRKLTKEQETLAQFIASRYRVALDSTREFVDHTYRVAKDLKIDPWLILAIMGIESSYDPDAVSHKGAQGLMQVLTRVHADKFAPFGGVAAAFDPLSNIKVGARILKDYIDRDGSIEAALKSYVGAALLPDDRGYGAKVLTERERLAAIAEGRPMNSLPMRAAPDKPRASAVNAEMPFVNVVVAPDLAAANDAEFTPVRPEVIKKAGVARTEVRAVSGADDAGKPVVGTVEAIAVETEESRLAR